MELYDHELTDEEYVQFMEEELFPRQSLLNFARWRRFGGGA